MAQGIFDPQAAVGITIGTVGTLQVLNDFWRFKVGDLDPSWGQFAIVAVSNSHAIFRMTVDKKWTGPRVHIVPLGSLHITIN